jgi:probable HAF family extracellular repeat protein
MRMRSCACCLPLLVALPASAQTASFTGLGQMPNAMHGAGTFANSVSADGSSVVGYGWDAQGRARAWRWTESTGIVDLGDLGGGTSEAYDVNADGTVVVGYSYSATNEHLGFRWTPGAGMQALPMYEVIDVSGDGDFMVGINIWRTASGQAGFFDPAGFGFWAAGVSTNGQVVVGYKYVNTRAHAFRWTQAGGLLDLGVTTGTESDARGVSGNGLVIVGEAQDNSIQGFYRAFRWTAQGGMQDLGILGGPMSAANDASFDGSVIVGTALASSSSSSNRAFRWTSGDGMQDLKQLLLNAGVSEVQNWLLFTANAVSSDGRVITGYGYPAPLTAPEPFISILPAPGGAPCYPNCDGSTSAPALNVQDFTCFLQRYAAGESYANCDQSTQAPTLNVQDFTCFLQSYAAGCP